MELVEGDDLAERLKRGPPPPRRGLSIARQIAEALEEAHEKGIVHRDLKPQNVKAPVDGKVKVLDFGLAKAMDPPGASSAADLARSPTIMNSPTMTAAHGTQLGVILGTAAYMSPEQARGGAVDKRADIWAFGVVLFEMLSGRSLFAADTVSDTLAGVLKTEIDFAALPAATPPALRQLLRRCLERSPKNRLHDIADARIVLDDLIAGRPGDEVARARPAPRGAPRRRPRPGSPPSSWRPRRPGSRRHPREPARDGPAAPLRLSIQLSAEPGARDRRELDLAFSPDGRQPRLHRADGRTPSLFRRDLGGREAVRSRHRRGRRSLLLSRRASGSASSPGGKLMKVAAAGGRPFRIAEPAERAVRLARDGTIVFAPNYADGLFRVPAAGGTPERLTTPDGASGELGHWWPDLLPGERTSSSPPSARPWTSRGSASSTWRPAR